MGYIKILNDLYKNRMSDGRPIFVLWGVSLFHVEGDGDEDGYKKNILFILDKNHCIIQNAQESFYSIDIHTLQTVDFTVKTSC